MTGTETHSVELKNPQVTQKRKTQALKSNFQSIRVQEKHMSAGASHSSPLVFEAPSHQLFLGTAVGQAAVKASRAGFISSSSLLPCELAGIDHILPSLQMRKLRPGVNTPN